MPLNKDAGEHIDGLPGAYRVVPNQKWRESKLFDQAAEEAAKIFAAQGALLPIGFDDDEVLSQEYPSSNQLAFLFVKNIRGQEHFYPYVYALPVEMVAELAAIGRWKPIETRH